MCSALASYDSEDDSDIGAIPVAAASSSILQATVATQPKPKRKRYRSEAKLIERRERPGKQLLASVQYRE